MNKIILIIGIILILLISGCSSYDSCFIDCKNIKHDCVIGWTNTYKNCDVSEKEVKIDCYNDCKGS